MRVPDSSNKEQNPTSQNSRVSPQSIHAKDNCMHESPCAPLLCRGGAVRTVTNSTCLLGTPCRKVPSLLIAPHKVLGGTLVGLLASLGWNVCLLRVRAEQPRAWYSARPSAALDGQWRDLPQGSLPTARAKGEGQGRCISGVRGWK